MSRLSSRLAFGALFAAVVAGWLAAFGVFSPPPSFLPIGTQNITSGDTSLTGTAAVTRLSDFNRDTFTDLVARDTAGKLWISPGNGAGGLQARHLISAGWNMYTLLASPGDVTGDGTADVLGVNPAGQLWLYPGNGHGGLGARREIGFRGWQKMTSITSAGDLNGDGHNDLLACDSSGVLWLYPMTGNAAFGTRTQRTKISKGWKGYTILGPGDVSGDGLADILARDPTGRLWLYRGNGAGGVGAPTLVSTGWQRMTALVAPGNWDRAAGNDLLARDARGRLWLYPGDNAGGFGWPHQIDTGWNIMTYIG
jgi:hypothetical protein